MSEQDDVQKIVNDAEGYAKSVLTDAGTAIDSVLSAAAAGEGATVIKIEGDAQAALLDLVPGAFRAEVAAVIAPFVQSGEGPLNSAISAEVAKGLAIAKARVNALTGATS